MDDGDEYQEQDYNSVALPCCILGSTQEHTDRVYTIQPPAGREASGSGTLDQTLIWTRDHEPINKPD